MRLWDNLLLLRLLASGGAFFLELCYEVVLLLELESEFRDLVLGGFLGLVLESLHVGHLCHEVLNLLIFGLVGLLELRGFL